ncbi:hypothetical protein ABC337_12860 [Arthrobacter sp. 1P04PC]|uniref:hypothetical protein n=1 Tax=unclassified Arthrobacter TaxID=235627 RepID=UPI00399F2016
MTLLDAARKDDRVATALHEAGHAVAYLSIGRAFEYLSAVDWQLVGNGQTIDAWDRAVTAMAGPAVESIMYHVGRGGDTEIYGWIVDQLQQRREFAQAEPCDEPDDYIHAGPYAEAALPVTMAVITSSWGDVERIAAAALNTDRLTYGEVLRLTVGGTLLADEVSRWQAIAGQR